MWVHDFHLMLVPAMLRRRDAEPLDRVLPAHPLPVERGLPPASRDASSSFAACSARTTSASRSATTRGTSARRACGSSASTPSPTGSSSTAAASGSASIRSGSTSEGFRARLIADPETARLLADLEHQYEGRRLVLGVERLDYTKGIPQKLQAFERFLEQDPERARTTTMIQVLVPSRLESPEYRAQRDEIELLIARINGRFGQPGSTPVEYIHRDISKPALVALYRRADVMMITALRDGMNLVAHEFVLCQSEPGLPGRWRGALLLSELAGAAQVLPGALLVNPWNVDGVVEHLATALELTARERQRRLETMAKRVEDLDTPALGRGLPHAARPLLAARSPDEAAADGRRGDPGADRAPLRPRARAHDPARLRRDAPRVRGPPRSRPADAGDPCAPAIARGAPGDRRAHRQRPPAPEPRAVARPAARSTSAPSTGTSRARRAASGGRSLDLDLSLAAPDRATAAARRRRRPRRARRAEVVQRRLALPAGRARVRVVARARAPERPPPASRGRAGRDPRRSSGRRGARARRRQGRLRAESLPEREGADALRARARRRPDRPRPARRACRRGRSPATSAACFRASAAPTGGARTSTSSGRARCARSCGISSRASARPLGALPAPFVAQGAKKREAPPAPGGEGEEGDRTRRSPRASRRSARSRGRGHP